ncbi:MAG: hypothetical protein Kow0032_14620 [Methyloligellaceae bacterium]
MGPLEAVARQHLLDAVHLGLHLIDERIIGDLLAGAGLALLLPALALRLGRLPLLLPGLALLLSGLATLLLRGRLVARLARNGGSDRIAGLSNRVGKCRKDHHGSGYGYAGQ